MVLIFPQKERGFIPHFSNFLQFATLDSNFLYLSYFSSFLHFSWDLIMFIFHFLVLKNMNPFSTIGPFSNFDLTCLFRSKNINSLFSLHFIIFMSFWSQEFRAILESYIFLSYLTVTFSLFFWSDKHFQIFHPFFYNHFTYSQLYNSSIVLFKSWTFL